MVLKIFPSHVDSLSSTIVRPSDELLIDERSLDISPEIETTTESLKPTGDRSLVATNRDRSTPELTPNTNGQPSVTHIYTVKPTIIAVQIDAGSVLYGEQTPYAPRPEDSIREPTPLVSWVFREGKPIGSLVGRNRDILYSFDIPIGQPLDTTGFELASHYSILSEDDPAFSTAIAPEAVFRKSAPTDIARTGTWNFEWPMRHTLYLVLSQPLTLGASYTVSFPNSALPPTTFQYSPNSTRSESVHMSQVGFRPDDSVKVGFLSEWMGDGGGVRYPEGLAFHVVDEASDRAIYSGQTVLSKLSHAREDPRGRNYNGTDVYRMDFSGVTQPGSYRLCVDGVGCSFPFDISDTAWSDAFRVSARGFYHQRSGIALGQPFTDYVRPRPFHPDDGVTVYQTSVTLFDAQLHRRETPIFDRLLESRSDRTVPAAWGGYFDAGDWDRRIQHLDVARNLLELEELFPAFCSEVSLNIPESSNALPDVMDEALWGIDFFRRLQTPDGGIPGGIESARHPRYGEASWQESLTVMAFAPGTWSSYLYAGVAARAAYLLQPVDAELANTYRDSALRAMTFAERTVTALGEESSHHLLVDSRNLAAIELYRLTGDRRWHQLFLQTTQFQSRENEVFAPGKYQQRDAAFIYARLTQQPTDVIVQQHAIDALLREADRLSELTANTGFGWSKSHPWEPIAWGTSFGAPKAMAMLRAHTLTGNSQYLNAALLASQFSAGANPNNTIYTTGLGHRSPQHPLLIDARVMGMPPPPGITVYGPLDPSVSGGYWFVDQLLNPVTYPVSRAWPTAEGYFDVYFSPAVNEFTVFQTMAPTAYTWGYLAARQAQSSSQFQSAIPSQFSDYSGHQAAEDISAVASPD